MSSERALPWIPQPVVDFPFTEATLEDAVGHALAELAFTRAGATATRVNEIGYIETVAVNEPRFDYDPATLECLGLMVEEARTNIHQQSADPNNAAWTKSNTTVSNDARAAPDGTLTADDVSNTVSVNSFIGPTSAALSLNTTYTNSIFAKAITGTGILAIEYHTGAAQSRAIFDLVAGTVSSAPVSGSPSARIEAWGNDGWYRCHLTFTTDAASVALARARTYYIGAYGSTATPTTIALWGSQLEAGAFATSYIPTTSASVTRNAESPALALGAWFNADAGVWAVEFRTKALGSGNPRIIGYNTSPSEAPISLITGATPFTNGAASTWDGADDARTVNTYTLGSVGYCAMAYERPTDVAISLNGGAVGSNGTSDFADPATAYFGTLNGATLFLNGHIRRVRYFDERLSDERLAILSAGDELATGAPLEDPVVYPALLYLGEFVDESGVSQYLRLWSGLGSLEWDGQTWTGQGQLLGVSQIEETVDVKAVGFTVSLQGQKSSNISLALSSAQRSRGRDGKVWLALFDSAGVMLDEPMLLKRGRLDRCPIEDEGDTCTLTAHYEDRLVDLKRPRVRRYSDQDQKAVYATDRGFEQVAALQDMQINWGRS